MSKPKVAHHRTQPYWRLLYLFAQQNRREFIINKSKINLITMFTLCKTVIVYNNNNQYHPNLRDHTSQVDQQEIKFLQQPIHTQRHTPKNSSIQTVESHTVNLRRTGISLSIKSKALEGSPQKSNMSNSTKHREDNLSLTEAQSPKTRTVHHKNSDFPMQIDSQITWGDMSPRLKGYDSLDTRLTAPEQEAVPLCYLPSKKAATRTTNNSALLSSLGNSTEKHDSIVSPLKKSTNFLRTSRPKLEEGDSSPIRRAVDQKLNASHIRREDVSQSLLQLSCSSYTEVLSRPRQLTQQQFEQTCSLQLKKQSSCLQDYVDEVTESVIINKTMQSNQEYKLLKNNSNFRKHSQPNDLNQSYINIEEKMDSPLKKIKKRYGNELLNLYDKDTIVSKSMESRVSSQPRQIIDESILIEHEIGNRFVAVVGSAHQHEQNRMQLVRETATGIVVSTKEVDLNRLHQVNHELNIYRQMQEYALNVDILRLFQLYTHRQAYVLIKEPYQITFSRYIQKHSKDYLLISWQFILKSIEDTLQRTITTVIGRGLQLLRVISCQDIVYVLGEWKLHSPTMFGRSPRPITPSQALSYLREDVLRYFRQNSVLAV